MSHRSSDSEDKLGGFAAPDGERPDPSFSSTFTPVSGDSTTDESLSNSYLDPVTALFEQWSLFSPEERLQNFSNLEREEAEEFLISLGARDQAELLLMMPASHRRTWIRQLAPDDAADLIQETPPEDHAELIALLDRVTRREVTALLAYAEDEAGGLMSPRYARLRPEMSVDEAITYLRRQARRPIETITYLYVLDHSQTLLGVVSLRDLFLGTGTSLISEIMQQDVIRVHENTNQEEVSRLIQQHNLIAVPVVDEDNILKGIITIDDAMEAIEEEVTEDIQKIGGTEALDTPYLSTPLWTMVRKRASWLSILFVGETFTASAMAHYEVELQKAVVLAMFIPLVISSGGNSGSQASTLVIRAIALGEAKVSHWSRVFVREIMVGLALGVILGTLGFLRVMLWPQSAVVYGEHYIRIGLTLCCSLIGIVLWGTVTGSMLPFILQRFRLDPASASAPFVATLVDVSGLVIYFTFASLFLSGYLL